MIQILSLAKQKQSEVLHKSEKGKKNKSQKIFHIKKEQGKGETFACLSS